MIQDIARLTLQHLPKEVWIRRVASVTLAAGTTVVVAKAVQEVSKAVIEVKNLVRELKK
jgi:hypothetical protein